MKIKTIWQHISKNNYAILAAVLTVGLLATPFVSADRFEDQISQLKQKNAQNQQAQRSLEVQAASLQEKIDALAAQISTLEKQITDNQAKSDKLKLDIKAAEEELERQRKLLGENIKAMYLEGDITTLEMLASSKDLSEFVDKQQYRNSVKDKIKQTLDKVNALKLELKKQKDSLDKLIEDQKGMQAVLDTQRAEQNRLLALNESERRQIDAKIKENNDEIAELRRQQAIENAKLFGNGLRNIPDTSGYPWAGVEPFPNTYVDPWGMYMRQCVSYTAWKVWKSGRHMPYWGGFGNANQWDDNARAAGIPVDGNPRVGDVAVSNSGRWGHVMYVEHVYEDGRILVSQYNASWDGRYSEAVIWPGSLVFIHFP